jgi:hypothetical protein
MNCLRRAIAGLLLVGGVSAAAAAPPIPSSVLPGRERDRFADSPVERFMQPGPYQAPQVVAPAKPQCGKPVHSKARPARRKGC